VSKTYSGSITRFQPALVKKKESYQNALSHEMTQVAWVKLGVTVRYFRPIHENLMYTDYDFEYLSHLLTTFNLTLNYYK